MPRGSAETSKRLPTKSCRGGGSALSGASRVAAAVLVENLSGGFSEVLEAAAAHLDAVLRQPTVEGGPVDWGPREELRGVLVGALGLSPGGPWGPPVAPWRALELLGDETINGSLLQAAAAAAECSCCLACTSSGEAELARAKLLGALRAVRGRAVLCYALLLVEQQPPPQRFSEDASTPRPDGDGGRPAALLLSAERGAAEAALQLDPIVAALYPPPERAFLRAPPGEGAFKAAPADTVAALQGAAAESAEGGSAYLLGEEGSACAYCLAAALGCSSVASSILLTVRLAVRCLPPLSRGHLLLQLLETAKALARKAFRVPPRKTSSAPSQLLAALRGCEVLVVAAESLSLCLDEAEEEQQADEEGDSQAAPQQELSPTERVRACPCFYCSPDTGGASAAVSSAPSAAAADVERAGVQFLVLVWGCVARAMEALGALRGPHALAPHLPSALIPLFEALGSSQESLAAAARRALQALHDAAGSCPFRQQQQQRRQEQQAEAVEISTEASGGKAQTTCSDCRAVQEAEEVAAAAESAWGSTPRTLRRCTDGAKCLLQTEGSLLLDELACRVHRLSSAWEASSPADAEGPHVVSLLSAVIALASPSLMGPLGALLTTLLQQQLQLAWGPLDAGCEGAPEPKPSAAAMPLWLLRLLSVFAFFLSNRVVTSRRASYAASWGGLYRCMRCCCRSSAGSAAPTPPSLPRQRICRRSPWATAVTSGSRGSEALRFSSESGIPESLVLLRRAALLGCDEDGKALDGSDAAADSPGRDASDAGGARETASLEAGERLRRGLFGDLRMQATHVLLHVRLHLRDSRPLAAAYAHLAALRCLVVLSTRERELLPRVHEVSFAFKERVAEADSPLKVFQNRRAGGAVFACSLDAWKALGSRNQASTDIWPLLLPSLKAETPLRVFVLALGILKLLTATAAHFIRDRFARDAAAALPTRLCQLRLASAAENARRSEAYKTEFAIASALAFCGSVRPELFEKLGSLEAALMCCLRCLCRATPQAVVESATAALVALHRVHPARVWFKCSRAVALAQHLQAQEKKSGISRTPYASGELPRLASEWLCVLAHGCDWMHEATPHSRLSLQRTSKEAEQLWLELCSALDSALVEKSRPLLQRRLAAATTCASLRCRQSLRSPFELEIDRWVISTPRFALTVLTADKALLDCKYEAIYSWIASEESKALIVGGPSATLRPLHAARASATADSSSACEEATLPTEREGLQKENISAEPCAAAQCTSRLPATVSGYGSLRESEGARRLRSFDVITSRRALRCFLRFLLPHSSPYLIPFSMDVDLVGNTLLLTVLDPVKGRPLGYGINFEERFVSPAKMCTNDKAVNELTTLYVVQSVNLCGELKLAISAETDALDARFNPLRNSVSAESCCSSNKNKSSLACTFDQQMIGSNECHVHSCKQLSLLEKQLLQDCAPLVELKTLSHFREYPWEDTADQMRLGGAKLLLKASHRRGTLQTLQLVPIEHVEKQLDLNGLSGTDKWPSLVILLKKLREIANMVRWESSSDVACLRLIFDGGHSLRVFNREPGTVRLSKEAVTWLA
ncbi:transcription factor [Cyclospora cayetanensis]|uniref:Transcription factor n=1 Tax=Cyclospora cayetanensis TaxID=88456 RepID=A0A1D3D4N9_9EIME|nr:transcription factor [Cyclospora cayetanensis]